MISSICDCVIQPLNKIHNRGGNITIIEELKDVPFTVKRLYYIYDIPGGEARGGHAHKALRQLMVAASGSFDVLLDDGVNKKIITLNRPNYGLLIVPGIWRELMNFSSGAICLVLASHRYSSDDYVRQYNKFIELKSI